MCRAGGHLDTSAQEHLADLVAGLHSVTAPAYGLDRPTLIGPLDQPNTPGDDWPSFFRDQRLLAMARAAFDEGALDTSLLNRIEALAGRLEAYIDDPAPPSLLHGDLWDGNILCVGGRVTGLIDPAISYGDPEIELAFMTLFGTVSDRFFDRYGEHHPMRPGFFERRRDLYNLYPLLVHVRLFGGSYVGQVRAIVERIS